MSRLAVMLMWALSMDGAHAFASLRTSGTTTERSVTPSLSSTSRSYRSNRTPGDFEALAAAGKNRWWSPFLLSTEDQTPTAVTAQEGTNNARAVDDYLEFLERRYHRLHDSETSANGAGEVKFSAWKWLKQGSTSEDDEASPLATQQQRQQDDALFVLGVAGLASQKLLHKHHHHQSVTTPRPTTTMQTSAAIIETTSQPEEEESLLPAAASLLLVKLSPLARQVALRRKLLLRYQSRQFRALTATLAKALAAAPAHSAAALLRLGGGRKNIGVTLTVMAALCFFLLRPLSEVLVAVRSA